MPSVLVASPDGALRENARALFEARGYSVRQAATEREVWLAMQQALPDLVVLDPQIRGVFGTTPVVLLTDSLREMFVGKQYEA